MTNERAQTLIEEIMTLFGSPAITPNYQEQLEALNMALEALRRTPPEYDIVGKTVYRIRATREANYNYFHGGCRKKWSSLADTPEHLIYEVAHGADVAIEERVGVKTDLVRLNKTTFLTREHAEAKIKSIREAIERRKNNESN